MSTFIAIATGIGLWVGTRSVFVAAITTLAVFIGFIYGYSEFEAFWPRRRDSKQ
jgi:hypothetical protein